MSARIPRASSAPRPGPGRRISASNRARPLAWLALCALLGVAGPALSQNLQDSEVELEDVLEISLIDRDLVAFDALGSSTPSLRLEIGEEPLWIRASGRVGVVVTDRRLLGVTSSNGSWQEVRFRLHERRPDSAQIGKRVALVVTDKRLLGFDGQAGRWLVVDVGPHEVVRDARVGAQTAVILTDRSAYGLSPDVGGFYRIPMTIQEKVESVRVGANLATITTSWRILVFRAPIGTWSEERRNLR